jgi:hypothetical protein
MTTQPTEKAWRERLTFAAVTGAVSGVARAIISWALDCLTNR